MQSQNQHKPSFNEQPTMLEYAPPEHVLRSRDGSPTDVFEFVCAPQWHKQFIVHSFDRGTSRGGKETIGEEKKRKSLVQFASIASLASGLWSWVNPNYVMVWCESFSLRNPVWVGEKIKIFFRSKLADESPQIIEVEVQVFQGNRWLRVVKTNIQIVRTVVPK